MTSARSAGSAVARRAAPGRGGDLVSGADSRLVAVLDVLDAVALRRWCAAGAAALRRYQHEIDQLNVYPVPDGDTGTNLVLTLTAAAEALADGPAAGPLPANSARPAGTAEPAGVEAPARVLELMARGALLGARGNSGVIVSQLLRGLADGLSQDGPIRGRRLAGALGLAAGTARAAVAVPVEGTVLTVAAAAATAAATADTDDLATVVCAAARAATGALARTPEQLPALAAAGVVDAGGRGLCVLLDALVAVVTGDPASEPAGDAAVRAAPPDSPAAGPVGLGGPVRPPVSRPVTAARETGSPEYAYEVQFLLDADEASVRRLRATLATLGDSLVVVGTGVQPDGPPTWNVHVHVNDIGAAVEAGVVAGRPYRIAVTRFDDQVTTGQAVVDVGRGGVPLGGQPVAAAAGRAAVVVAAGNGLAEVFAAEGAVVVGGDPSTGELLDAIRSTGAAQVVVLPNDPDTQAVAGTAASRAQASGVQVRVVPTRSPVQALAALAVRDATRPFEDDVIAMAEAAGACRYAEVCHAGRDALTVAGPCRRGDVLALVEGEVNLVGDDLVDTCTVLLDRLLSGGGELVTLLIGADAPAGLADAVRAHAARHWPFVEMVCYCGGQPRYPLVLGVE